MADYAEWVDVDTEFGVVPSNNPRRPPTERPFWLTTPFPRPTRPPSTVTRIPWVPPGASIPHDSPELLPPRVEGGNETLALTMGVFGGLMGVILVCLFVYMFVLKRRLSQAKSGKSREDYSTRVTDVADLSSKLDDSSQLYANTSDMHKLMNSARLSRKNPPPVPGVPNGKPRLPLPPPVSMEGNEHQVNLRKAKTKTESANVVRVSFVSGFRRFSQSLGNKNLNFPSFWYQNKKNESHQKSTESVITMPEIVNTGGVPEILDDEDLWSEDSFDSCSIDYEDENSIPQRIGSVRRSGMNHSKRFSGNNTTKKPSVPPPAPPPETETYYGNFKPLPPSNPKPISVSNPKPLTPTNPKPIGVVRPAPPVPSMKSFPNNSGPNSLSSNSSNHDSIKTSAFAAVTPKVAIVPRNHKSETTAPPLPSLPKPHKPPVTPKPAAKPHLLPKLKIGLSVPRTTGRVEKTPDTTTTILSCTPGAEETNRFYGSKYAEIAGSDRNIDGNNTNGSNRSVKREESFVEPTNLSVSARKALLEGKNLMTQLNRK